MGRWERKGEAGGAAQYTSSRRPTAFLEAAARRPDGWRRRRDGPTVGGGGGLLVFVCGVGSSAVDSGRCIAGGRRRLPEAAGIGRQGGTLARFSSSHEARVGKREERGERLG
jgi:hypothetical protein